MSLPFVLDIALGLIFVYLTLSLLASKIQGLLTVLFQWRAVHLKQSIQGLLTSGTEDDKEVKEVKDLVNQIYNHPYINALNHEAREGIEGLFRQITQTIGKIYRKLTGKENIFGDQTSGPSKITGEIFAGALLLTIDFPEMIKCLKVSRLEKFQVEKLQQVRAVIDHLENLEITDDQKNSLEFEYNKLSQKFGSIVQDFHDNKADLSASIDHLAEQLDLYLKNCQIYLVDTEISAQIFENEMNKLKFDDSQKKAVIMGGWKSSLTDLLAEIKSNRKIYLELGGGNHDEHDQSYQQIESKINQLPSSVKNGLDVIFKITQTQVQNIEEVGDYLQKRLSQWYDDSMARADGVFKRNATGVTILISLFLAIAINADTLFIVDRLSKDSVLRNMTSQYATQVAQVEYNQAPGDFTQVQAKIDQVLENISLPIGWDQDNLNNQANYDKNDHPILAKIKRILGWVLTGLAISMGSNFWYDSLSQIIDFRNTGKKPKSPSA